MQNAVMHIAVHQYSIVKIIPLSHSVSYWLVATPIMTLLPDWVNPSFLIFDICCSGGANTPASYAAKFADRTFSVNRLQTG